MVMICQDSLVGHYGTLPHWERSDGSYRKHKFDGG